LFKAGIKDYLMESFANPEIGQNSRFANTSNDWFIISL